MKTIRLYKFYNHIQVAHLYEHLYAHALTFALCELGLYEYLDYQFDAFTYSGGFVEVKLLVENDTYEAALHTLNTVKINLDESNVLKVITHITIEKGRRASGDWQAMIIELTDLHSRPWIASQDLDIYDTQSIRRRNGSFYLLNDTVKTRVMKLDLSLSADFIRQNRALLPLAYILFRALSYQVRNSLIPAFPYYSYDQRVGIYRLGFGLTEVYKTDTKLRYNLESQALIVKEIIDQSRKDRFFNRFLSLFTENELPSQVDEIEVYEHTGILIGYTELYKTATRNNLEIIFKNLNITMHYGSRVERLTLTSEFE